MSASSARDLSPAVAHSAGLSMNDAFIVRQRDEIEELRERIRQLEELLCPILLTPSCWKLNPGENRLFCALTTRDWVTKEALGRAAQLHDDTNGDNLTGVLVCHIRRKTKRYGVQIETIWGLGYRLVDRERWARVLL